MSNIHERARELARTSRGQMTVTAAYSELGKRAAAARRRRNYGSVKLSAADCAVVEKRIAKPRLPYAEN